MHGAIKVLTVINNCRITAEFSANQDKQLKSFNFCEVMNKMTSSTDRRSSGSPHRGHAVFPHLPAELAFVRRLNWRKLGKALLLPPAQQRAHTAESGEGGSGNGKGESGNG